MCSSQQGLRGSMWHRMSDYLRMIIIDSVHGVLVFQNHVFKVAAWLIKETFMKINRGDILRFFGPSSKVRCTNRV